MVEQQLRIRVQGRLSQDTVEALGVEMEVVGDRFELVVQICRPSATHWLMLQLSDLHIAVDRIEVCDISPAGEQAQQPKGRGMDSRGKERRRGSRRR